MKKNNKGIIEPLVVVIIIVGLFVILTLFNTIRLGIARKETKKLTESKIESIINENDTFIYNGVEIDKSTAKELLEKGYFAFREKNTKKVYIEKENEAPKSHTSTFFIPLPIS